MCINLTQCVIVASFVNQANYGPGVEYVYVLWAWCIVCVCIMGLVYSMCMYYGPGV